MALAMMSMGQPRSPRRRRAARAAAASGRASPTAKPAQYQGVGACLMASRADGCGGDGVARAQAGEGGGDAAAGARELERGEAAEGAPIPLPLPLLLGGGGPCFDERGHAAEDPGRGDKRLGGRIRATRGVWGMRTGGVSISPGRSGRRRRPRDAGFQVSVGGCWVRTRSPRGQRGRRRGLCAGPVRADGGKRAAVVGFAGCAFWRRTGSRPHLSACLSSFHGRLSPAMSPAPQTHDVTPQILRPQTRVPGVHPMRGTGPLPQLPLEGASPSSGGQHRSLEGRVPGPVPLPGLPVSG
jgi:hypothetical protein